MRPKMDAEFAILILSFATAALAFLAAMIPVARAMARAFRNSPDKSRLKQIFLWVLSLIFFCSFWVAYHWFGHPLAGVLLLLAYYVAAMTAFAKNPAPITRIDVLWNCVIPSVNFVFLAMELYVRSFIALAGK